MASRLPGTVTPGLRLVKMPRCSCGLYRRVGYADDAAHKRRPHVSRRPSRARLRRGIDSGRRPTGVGCYKDPLPLEPCPVGRVGLKGETAGMPLLLFLSAFGFFFSRLLLN